MLKQSTKDNPNVVDKQRTPTIMDGIRNHKHTYWEKTIGQREIRKMHKVITILTMKWKERKKRHIRWKSNERIWCYSRYSTHKNPHWYKDYTQNRMVKEILHYEWIFSPPWVALVKLMFICNMGRRCDESFLSSCFEIILFSFHKLTICIAK